MGDVRTKIARWTREGASLELIEERLQENPERRFLGELGAGHDICALNCCQLGGRHTMPQVAPERATA